MFGAWDLKKPFEPKFKKGDKVQSITAGYISTAIAGGDSFLNESGCEVFYIENEKGYFDCKYWEKIK